MTLDELLAREGIRRTIAAYTAAGDRLRKAEFVACFTEDALFETDGVAEADSFRREGRDAIAQWIARWRNRPADAAPVHGASFVRHHLTTCHIELAGPNSASARTYWSAWTDIGPDHAGYYLDEFRRVGELWLIAHRRIREDWRSPQSLFTGAVSQAG
ncbi:MAG: nuclear transport factor 2 family protein [Sphingobium sp.]